MPPSCLSNSLQAYILRATGAESLFEAGVLQVLWSGYGKIIRYGLNGGLHQYVIVKHVQLEKQRHPVGWNSDLSHQRKLRSYQVESAWYQHYSSRCGRRCRVPECLGIDSM